MIGAFVAIVEVQEISAIHQLSHFGHSARAGIEQWGVTRSSFLKSECALWAIDSNTVTLWSLVSFEWSTKKPKSALVVHFLVHDEGATSSMSPPPS